MKRTSDLSTPPITSYGRNTLINQRRPSQDTDYGTRRRPLQRRSSLANGPLHGQRTLIKVNTSSEKFRVSKIVETKLFKKILEWFSYTWARSVKTKTCKSCNIVFILNFEKFCFDLKNNWLLNEKVKRPLGPPSPVLNY